MRERETGDNLPLGGLQADEMRFGKTVMMIVLKKRRSLRIISRIDEQY